MRAAASAAGLLGLLPFAAAKQPHVRRQTLPNRPSPHSPHHTPTPALPLLDMRRCALTRPRAQILLIVAE